MSTQQERPDNQIPKQEEEVDLVPVFVWIGNGIKNLFNGIGRILGGIGHFFVLFLIFCKKNIILLSLFLVAGIALGFYLDREQSKSFTAVVRVKPNFGSAAQVISNVEFYTSLVGQEDFNRLAQELDITVAEAEEISGFDIEADFSNNELLREYDDLARASDSVAISNFDYTEFKEAKRDIDYKTYIIEVYGSSKAVVEKVAERASKVKELSAILAAKKASQETARFNIQNLKNQLTELDSLVASYQKAIVASTESSSAATNLYLSDQKPNEILKQLFDQKLEILDDLRKERQQLYSYENTVNVASIYTKQGAVENPHYKIKLGIVFLGLGLIVASIPVLFRWLNEYEKKALS